MSVKHTSLVLEFLDTQPPIKLVALILADHADVDGLCWPSYRRISQLSCQSERTVRRHVKALIEMGVVSKLRTGAIVKREGRSIRISNAYRIHAHVLTRKVSLLKTQKLSTSDLLATVADDHLEQDTADTPTWSPVTTKPSTNHQSNHHTCGNVHKSSGSVVTINDAMEEILRKIT